MPRATPRLRGRVLTPLAISMLVHALLVTVVVGVTLSRPARRGEAAEFVLLPPKPVPAEAPTEPAPPELPEATPEVAPALPTQAPTPSPGAVSRPSQTPRPAPARADPPERPAPLPPEAEAPAPVTFAGSRASATRIVYVVDLSGSMVSSLGLVIGELERSIAALDDRQRFEVIFFHEQELEPSVEMYAGGWVSRGGIDLDAVSGWLRERLPGGRSSPMEGLRAAIELEPDVIFFLSRSIRRTGGSAWDRDAVLAELEDRNPKRDGSRRITIKAIQFIDDDPTGTMRAIGEAHGGADGYRVLRLDELE